MEWICLLASRIPRRSFQASILLLVFFLWTGFPGADPSFRSVDQRALAVPPRFATSIQSLVAQLCPRTYSETQKARAIYRWITANIGYDLDSIRGPRKSQEAEDVLRSRLGVCEGYARLFHAMAEEAGLEAVYIVGRGHQDARRHLPYPITIYHAWNAVKVAGRWRLLDATWGAGYIRADRFVSEFEDFWFSTPPDQFIFTHLPEEDRWQLMMRPWSEARFDRAPRLNKFYFTSRAQLMSPQEGVLAARRRHYFRIRVPGAKKVLVALGSEAVATLEEEQGYFQGWVELPASRGELRLHAVHPLDKNQPSLVTFIFE